MINTIFKKVLPILITLVILFQSTVNAQSIEFNDNSSGYNFQTSNTTKFFEETFGLDKTQSFVLIGIIIAAGFLLFSKILGTFAKITILILTITLALLLIKN